MPTNQAAFKGAAKEAKVKLVGPKTAFLIQEDGRAGTVADAVPLSPGILFLLSILARAIAEGARLKGAISSETTPLNRPAKAACFWVTELGSNNFLTMGGAIGTAESYLAKDGIPVLPSQDSFEVYRSLCAMVGSAEKIRNGLNIVKSCGLARIEKGLCLERS